MGYNMLVFSRAKKRVSAARIRSFIKEAEFDVKLEVFPEGKRNWTQICISHNEGDQVITLIEPQDVRPGTQTDYLINEIESARNSRPASAARWVVEFLQKVQTIYLFRIGSGTDVNDGWYVVRELQELIRDEYDGILHAEGEGFSNQQGYQITWEFSDRATGEWHMAVLDGKRENWARFTMELGNREHRRAFQDGLVPEGVKSY